MNGGENSTLNIVKQELATLGVFRDFSEGAIAIDVEGRVTWINEKYAELLSIPRTKAVLGSLVEDVIPESRLPEIVQSGKPIMLDIMRFNDRHFVVCRLPLRDRSGAVSGALGVVFFSDLEQLNPLLLRYQDLERKVAEGEAELKQMRRARYSLSSFLGTSDTISVVRKRARLIAPRESAVLIFGETGVGKELLAHGIHLSSSRSEGPFIVVNAASFRDEDFEAQFFGYYRVLPNGERKLVPGKLMLAHGGTLFIDELGNIPLSVQAKFLRVLEDGVIELPDCSRLEKSNFRVIATTSVDLHRHVASGLFRQDLYYRLAVLPISVPPLRTRSVDIDLLTEVGLDMLGRKSGGYVISSEALQLLKSHTWPGNVRELFSVLERASLETEVFEIGAKEVALALNMSLEASPSCEDPEFWIPLSESLHRAEKSAIVDALIRSRGNKELAAQRLGVSRSSLYSKLKVLGVDEL